MAVNLNLALPYFSSTQSADDTAPIYSVGSGDAPVVRVFSTTLLVNYMIDEPGALVIVRQRDVELGKRDDLHTRALDNLRAHVEKRKLRFEPRGGTLQAKLDGQHDASLLLLDELWDSPTRVADLDGDIIAAVPSRNLLVFTGTKTRGGIAELRARIAENKDRELSPELFVRRKGAWDPFEG